MKHRIGVVVMALAASAAGAIPAQQKGPTVAVYRTFMDPEFTVVQGLVRVDPIQLAAETCEYGVAVVVRDKQANKLVDNTWENTCPRVNGVHAAGLETFQFGLRPAEYTVEVSVFPKSRPTDRHTTTVTVQAFQGKPLASDLILAKGVGLVDSATASQWSMRRGQVGLRAASEMVIDPAEPNLSYYVELYPREGRPLNGKAEGVIRRADGRELHTIPLSTLSEVTQPWPLAASLSVAGLPAGSYTFDVRVQLGDTTVVRSHPFRMLETVAAAGSAGGYFASLTDEQLAELFDPVVTWLSGKAEIDRYHSLSPAGKRQFLMQQFGNVAPTPDDGEESALDAYLGRVQYVNARFAERAGRGTVAGWETDRGRIYMLRGEPSSKAAKPAPVSGSPYELWYYTTQNRYAYLFADETRMGNYRLIWTNDPQQQGVQDWDRRVGPEAIDDMRSMGIQLPRMGGSEQ